MSGEDFDQRIAAAKVELEQRRAEAEAITTGFVEATVAALEKWVPSSVSNQAKTQHAVTTAKGQEGVTALKAALTAFVSEFSKKLKSYLLSDRLWRHRAGFVPSKSGDYSLFEYWVHGPPYKDALPDALGTELKQIIKRDVGGFLKKHGYSLRRHSDGSEEFYPDRFPVPQELLQKLAPYREASRLVEEAKRAVAREEEKKQEAAAADLWEKA